MIKNSVNAVYHRVGRCQIAKCKQFEQLVKSVYMYCHSLLLNNDNYLSVSVFLKIM